MNASLQLLRTVLPSIVQIRARIPPGHPSTAILGAERSGTATVIDPAGLLLTANYVVIGAKTIDVSVFDGRTVAGEVAARDYETGIAVVRILERLPAVSLRSSVDLVTGEEVFIAAGVGDGGVRIATGAVSYLGPYEAYWEYLLDRSVVATALSPGVGGGPVFDRLGRMVAIASLNLGEVGRFSLGVPVEYFMDKRTHLLASRAPSPPRRAWVGLYSATVQRRVVLAGVMPGSPAERAGLAQGDVVLAVDGGRIADRADLYRRIWRRRPGDAVAFEVFRGNSAKSISVTATSAEEMFA